MLSYCIQTLYIHGSTTGDERSSGKTANGSLPHTIMMANSHRFDDVAHIGIRLVIGNRQYTVCINSLLLTVSSLA